MKLRFRLFIGIMTLFLFMLVSNASFAETGFSTFGVKNDIHRAALSSGDWNVLPGKNGVSLNKEWTVNFSNHVTLDKIDAAVIEKDGHFIPVDISVTSSKAIKIKPVYGYSGNSKYTLKVILANGKKYKLDFTTENVPRNFDQLDNGLTEKATELYIGETISDNVSVNKEESWYKIHITEPGTLNLELKHNKDRSMSMYLYGEKDTTSSIEALYYSSHGTLVKSLAPGTYYIKIDNSSDGGYTLTNTFTVNRDNDPNPNADNIFTSKAQPLNLNQLMTAHIGYTYDNGYKNEEDWYKITVTEPGLLNLELKHQLDQSMSMFLYGVKDTKSSIDALYYTSQGSIVQALAPGEYYVKVEGSKPGTYTLNSQFRVNNDPDPNPLADNTFTTSAKEISLGDSIKAHIGYTYETGYKNTFDWYKINVTSPGKLTIDLKHMSDRTLSAHLYPESDTTRSIGDIYYTPQGTIQEDVTPGTYYIKVESDYAGSYTITTH